MTPTTRQLTLHLADLDPTLLPRSPGGSHEDLAAAASEAICKQLARLGGLVESVRIAEGVARVTWRPDPRAPDPLDTIVAMLQAGELRPAVLLLELLLSDDPDNTTVLYNLGMAHSDLGRLDRAVDLLRRLLELEPGNVHGRVALGVALTRRGEHEAARLELERAAHADPSDPWAHRNLGAALLHLGRYSEAADHLRRAAELSPSDERAWYGLGQALEAAGDDAGADEAYRRVLALTEVGEIAELARRGRSAIAQRCFRASAPAGLRMDAVFHCLDALQRFEAMTPDEVRRVGYEIAVLGMGGIDVNDPTPKYRLRSLPGTFSGLHLVALEYVAFQRIDPELDIGFDLADEYRAALELHRSRTTPE